MRLVWFEVEGYKNLQRRLRLHDLGGLNVIHGDNNAGKSNLLEAIGVFFEALGLFQSSSIDSLAPYYGDPSTSVAGIPLLTTWPTSFASSLFPSFTLAPELPLSKVLAPQQRLLGQPIPELFHVEKRAPIRLAAGIEIPLDRLSSLGLKPSTAGVHNIELALVPTGDGGTELHLRRWQVNDVPLVPKATGPKTELPLALLGELARSCAFIPVGRDLLGSASGAENERDPYSYRDRIPAALCLKLYDAQQASEPVQRESWERFVEAMEPFSAFFEGGRLAAEYDRHNQRARLVVIQKGSRRIPIHMLGAGVQQIITLIGTLASSSASLALIEEPELNLRYTHQMRLRDAFQSLTRPTNSNRQFVLTTHSVGFENDSAGDNAFFYGLSAEAEGPKLERRPVGEAAIFTENKPFVKPRDGKKPPPSWLSGEGLVQVPQRILDKMKIPQGGGVFFVQRKDTGHVELLTSAQFFDIVEPEDSDGDA